MLADLDRARDALHACDPGCDRETWVRLGMAAKAAGLDFSTFDEWSSRAESYREQDARAVWQSIRRVDGVGPGTLYKAAAQAGWTPHGQAVSPRPSKAPQRPVAWIASIRMAGKTTFILAGWTGMNVAV